MGIAHEVVKKIGQVLGPVHAGTEKLAASKLGTADNAILKVSSDAFRIGESLPRAATSDGEGTPPMIRWQGVPPSARSVAVVCEDPDAPLPQPFVHWIVYGLPGRDATLDTTLLATAREGANSKGLTGYTGAAPPPGHGLHHYHFQVFALDVPLELGAGAGRSEVLEAMRGHVVAWGDLVGTYARD
jgi:Raf kinase inhibitor-like YbhB/YbcL family protein